MPRDRLAATTLAILAVAVAPAAASAASYPPLTQTPPPSLIRTAAPPSSSPQSPPLPKTGDDLRIEGAIALLFLAAGVALRRRDPRVTLQRRD
jgi:hypothetical protein